jgi:hypothetical protein
LEVRAVTEVSSTGAEELLLSPGERLVFRRELMDRGEAEWMHLLAEFDRDGLWGVDGQSNCPHWLEWRAKLAPATAYEKCRVAAELNRRPLVAAAFDAGDISYSATRAICRIDRPDPEVDAALVAVAKAGTVRDVERAVRTYRAYADQERPLEDIRAERRGIRIRRGQDGMSTAEVTLTDLEMDELVAALRAHDEHPTAQPVDDSARAEFPGEDGGESVDDSARAEDGGQAGADTSAQGVDIPVDDSPRANETDADEEADEETGVSGPEVRLPGWQRRADALMDLLRQGSSDDTYATGGDRYLVHLIIDPTTGRAQRLDGTPVASSEAAQVLCDTAIVEHHYGEDGELLNLGRKAREWNTSQRRAITVRDGGKCRFPGCTNTICDIHHLREWTNGGPTDIANGGSLCRFHHGLVHKGFTATGTGNGAITFHRPDGTPIATTHPLARNWQLAA